MKAYSLKRGIISLVGFALVLGVFVYMLLQGFGYDHVGKLNSVSLGLDLRGGVSITYQVADANASQEDILDAINKMQLRVYDYSTEAVVYQEGSDRITIDIPGKNDATEVLQELGRPGTLIFCTDETDPEGSMRLTGDDLSGAYPAVDDDKNYVVILQFKEEGQKKFASVTKELAGTGNSLYIIYDGNTISAPTCQSEINSTTCQIEGDFTYDSATQLASYIRIGALPVELTELRSQVVGATMGSQAITTSLMATLIGLAIICILMIVLFRIPGVASALALIFYTITIGVILSIFNQEITLTLPGIAGIVLSIGMAIDADVIIFSRIREELGKGAGVQSAINAGFKKALSAIIDGNVTTLIAAAVLYFFGSGTIKGFAITLAIGIVLSMITSLVVTKIILKSLHALGFKNQKFYGIKKPVEKPINFLSKKNICFIASLTAVVIGIVFMIINGTKTYPLNFSLDFVGGTSTSVTLNENYSVPELEEKVEPKVEEAIGSTDVTITPVMGSNEIIVKTQVLSQEQREKLYDVFEKDFQVDVSNITYENISGTISGEMQRSAIISVILATIAMLIYIWIRFRDLRFAGSSVIALFHDVLVVLAGYAVFRWSVGNTFIACMLTLVGYSINATIVIFDRIRENMKELGDKADLKEVVNLSITQTLGRSVYTSITTFVMVAALYILGVTSIREFALPLMVGIVVGGYSSVCLAGALWYVFKTKVGKKA